MNIANRIRELCLQAEVAPEGLEEMAGFGEGYIKDFESGKIASSCDALGRLAEALSLPFEQLFYEDISSVATPRLRARMTLMELAQEDPGQRRRRPTLLSRFRSLVTVGVPKGDGRHQS